MIKKHSFQKCHLKPRSKDVRLTSRDRGVRKAPCLTSLLHTVYPPRELCPTRLLKEWYLQLTLLAVLILGIPQLWLLATRSGLGSGSGSSSTLTFLVNSDRRTQEGRGDTTKLHATVNIIIKKSSLNIHCARTFLGDAVDSSRRRQRELVCPTKRQVLFRNGQWVRVWHNVVHGVFCHQQSI